VLTETSALLSSRVGKATEIEFLDWVAAGGVTVADLDHADLDALIGLLRKYRDMPFDFADTSVAALAASLGVDRILSVDRDFDIYRTASGGPSNSMPCARQRAGSCGGMALAFVTSRKKASILPAGIKAISILPRAFPTCAQTCGILRGASRESPG